MQALHTSWIYTPANALLYVEHVSNGQQRGDRYSYTTDANQAKKMTEAQCKAFCSYMKDCASVGFWD